jgi:uncharacterized protein YqhQ
VSPRTFLRFFSHTQLLPILESGEETLVGGQAVMEGVMMRAPHSYCVAVRRPDGEIVTEELAIPRMSEQNPVWKMPVLRGLGTLGQAMSLGFRAMRFSMANALTEEAAPGETPEKAKEVPVWATALNIILSIGFFIVMYKFIPLKLATLAGKYYPALSGRIASNGVEGAIRLIIFISFLYLLSRAKDIRRVFEYHGAEHKVVFNFESGKPVDVKTAQSFVTWHPRCGTSFLIVLMLVSIPVYMLIPFDGFLAKFVTRIALLPLIVGMSYELIRFAAKRPGSFLALLTAPGLWLQRITTKPPSDEQAEIAIHALNHAMALEAKQGGELVIA